MPQHSSFPFLALLAAVIVILCGVVVGSWPKQTGQFERRVTMKRRRDVQRPETSRVTREEEGNALTSDDRETIVLELKELPMESAETNHSDAKNDTAASANSTYAVSENPDEKTTRKSKYVLSISHHYGSSNDSKESDGERILQQKETSESPLASSTPAPNLISPAPTEIEAFLDVAKSLHSRRAGIFTKEQSSADERKSARNASSSHATQHSSKIPDSEGTTSNLNLFLQRQSPSPPSPRPTTRIKWPEDSTSGEATAEVEEYSSRPVAIKRKPFPEIKEYTSRPPAIIKQKSASFEVREYSSKPAIIKQTPIPEVAERKLPRQNPSSEAEEYSSKTVKQSTSQEATQKVATFIRTVQIPQVFTLATSTTSSTPKTTTSWEAPKDGGPSDVVKIIGLFRNPNSLMRALMDATTTAKTTTTPTKTTTLKLTTSKVYKAPGVPQGFVNTTTTKVAKKTSTTQSTTTQGQISTNAPSKLISQGSKGRHKTNNLYLHKNSTLPTPDDPSRCLVDEESILDLVAGGDSEMAESRSVEDMEGAVLRSHQRPTLRQKASRYEKFFGSKEHAQQQLRVHVEIPAAHIIRSSNTRSGDPHGYNAHKKLAIHRSSTKVRQTSQNHARYKATKAQMALSSRAGSMKTAAATLIPNSETELSEKSASSESTEIPIWNKLKGTKPPTSVVFTAGKFLTKSHGTWSSSAVSRVLPLTAITTPRPEAVNVLPRSAAATERSSSRWRMPALIPTRATSTSSTTRRTTPTTTTTTTRRTTSTTTTPTTTSTRRTTTTTTPTTTTRTTTTPTTTTRRSTTTTTPTTTTRSTTTTTPTTTTPKTTTTTTRATTTRVITTHVPVPVAHIILQVKADGSVGAAPGLMSSTTMPQKSATPIVYSYYSSKLTRKSIPTSRMMRRNQHRAPSKIIQAISEEPSSSGSSSSSSEERTTPAPTTTKRKTTTSTTAKITSSTSTTRRTTRKTTHKTTTRMTTTSEPTTTSTVSQSSTRVPWGYAEELRGADDPEPAGVIIITTAPPSLTSATSKTDLLASYLQSNPSSATWADIGADGHTSPSPAFTFQRVVKGVSRLRARSFTTTPISSLKSPTSPVQNLITRAAVISSAGLHERNVSHPQVPPLSLAPLAISDSFGKRRFVPTIDLSPPGGDSPQAIPPTSGNWQMEEGQHRFIMISTETASADIDNNYQAVYAQEHKEVDQRTAFGVQRRIDVDPVDQYQRLSSSEIQPKWYWWTQQAGMQKRRSAANETSKDQSDEEESQQQDDSAKLLLL